MPGLLGECKTLLTALIPFYLIRTNKSHQLLRKKRAYIYPSAVYLYKIPSSPVHCLFKFVTILCLYFVFYISSLFHCTDSCASPMSDALTYLGLTSLRYLLTNNQIRTIDRRAFRALEGLVYIVLKGNPIGGQPVRFQVNAKRECKP